MRRRGTSGRCRHGLLVLAASVVTVLTGCGASGQDGPPTTESTTSGPVVQGPSLPAGWPAALTFPADATITYATADDTGMSVLFDAPQDLATLRAYFDARVLAMGYQRKTDDSFVHMLSTTWSDGPATISVTATPVDDRSSGVVLVQPND